MNKRTPKSITFVNLLQSFVFHILIEIRIVLSSAALKTCRDCFVKEEQDKNKKK